MLSKSVTFLDIRLSQGSVATLQVRLKSFVGLYTHREFSHETASDRILNIGLHFLKLL